MANIISSERVKQYVIIYKTIDDKILCINEQNFDNTIVSHKYQKKGVIIFQKPVTKIGANAFEHCTTLQHIILPCLITRIERNAFYDCCNLQNVSICDLAAWCNINFENIYANPLYNGSKLYIGNRELQELSIPQDIVAINDYAFSGCISIINAILPDNLTAIGDESFSNCKNLISINIPNKVTSIGNYAFYNCTNLANITISDSVTEIGVHAFDNCIALSCVSIGKNVSVIGNYAFEDCPSLKVIISKATTPPKLYYEDYYEERLIPLDIENINKTENTHIEFIVVPKDCEQAYENSDWDSINDYQNY